MAIYILSRNSLYSQPQTTGQLVNLRKRSRCLQSYKRTTSRVQQKLSRTKFVQEKSYQLNDQPCVIKVAQVEKTLRDLIMNLRRRAGLRTALNFQGKAVEGHHIN